MLNTFIIWLTASLSTEASYNTNCKEKHQGVKHQSSAVEEEEEKEVILEITDDWSLEEWDVADYL